MRARARSLFFEVGQGISSEGGVRPGFVPGTGTPIWILHLVTRSRNHREVTRIWGVGGREFSCGGLSATGAGPARRLSRARVRLLLTSLVPGQGHRAVSIRPATLPTARSRPGPRVPRRAPVGFDVGAGVASVPLHSLNELVLDRNASERSECAAKRRQLTGRRLSRGRFSPATGRVGFKPSHGAARIRRTVGRPRRATDGCGAVRTVRSGSVIFRSRWPARRRSARAARRKGPDPVPFVPPIPGFISTSNQRFTRV